MKKSTDTKNLTFADSTGVKKVVKNFVYVVLL